MKKIISIVLLMSILLSTVTFTTFAATDEIIVLTSQDKTVKETTDCKLTGTWNMSTGLTSVWGPDKASYVWYSTDKNAKASFNASQLNGTYGVYTWLSPFPTMTDLMDVTITASGKSTTITLDSTEKRDSNGARVYEWVYLGNYTFNGNSNDAVVHEIGKLAEVTGNMRVSAVKYVKNDTNTAQPGNIKQIVPDELELKDGEYVILDGNSTGFRVVGSWTDSSIYIREGAPTYYTNTKGHYAKWNFDAGKVDGVEVFVPKISNSSGKEDTETTFEINAGGTVHTVTHNFNEGNPKWISLGKYNFTGGGTEYVKISKTTSTGNTRAIGVMLCLNTEPDNYFPDESILQGNEELHIFERMGMYIAEPVTEEYIASDVTRAQMAVMLTRLFGKYDDIQSEITASKLTSGEIPQFSDTSSHKYKKTLAWIRLHPEFGLKKQGANSYSPDKQATKTELIKFILHQLGYYEGIDYATKNVKSFAEKHSIKTDGDEKLTVESMAKILYSAFDTKTNGKAETFFSKMVRENSGITDESLLSRKPLSADMKTKRSTSKNKDRGIIYNNDGNDVYKSYPEYPGDYPVTAANINTLKSGTADQTFLKERTTGLANTQVGSVFYCTGVVNSYTHIPRSMEASLGIDTRQRDWSYLLPEYGYDDTLKIMTDYVHENNREIFWSMRMNDTHDYTYEEDELDSWKQANLDKLVGRRMDSMFMVYGDRRWSSIDYTHTESRQKIYEILKDTITRYDLDGLELDLTRHPVYFKEVTLGYDVYPENVERMNNLIRMVRALTEKISMERGKPILVSICVPDSLGFCKAVGLDVETWIKEDLVDFTAIGWHNNAFQSWKDSVDEYNAITEKYGLEAFPVYAEIDPTAYGSASGQTAKNYDYNEALDALRSGVKGIYVYNYFSINDSRFDDLHSEETILASGRIDENYVSQRDTYGGTTAKDTAKYVTLNK